MSEKTKQKKSGGNCAAENLSKVCNEEAEPGDQGNWSEDQKKKSYYYDDAYGYEVYNPDQDDEEISK